jgi:hypothetical protein
MPNELEEKEWIKLEVVHVASWSWYWNTGIAKTSVASFAVYGAKSVGTCKAGYFVI